MRWLDGITDSMDMNLGNHWKIVRDREAWQAASPWGCRELDTTQQQNNKNNIFKVHNLIRDHSVIFEMAPEYRISDSFVDYEGYSISSKGFLTTVIDTMVI